MKKLQLFNGKGEEIAVLEVAEVSNRMLTSIYNLKSDENGISFDTDFGQFFNIPHSEEGFAILQDAEKSGAAIQIEYL